ncbi:MAG: hypothetical protein HQL95_14865 [Magnetococcales bacterium]|nr:hypothetical protein [Magnetococcales bacterium]
MAKGRDGEKRQSDQFDVPWKEIVEGYFQDFLAFFLSDAHNDIDWDKGYEFLDTELARITREAEIGDRRMDKLVKVWRCDGNECWVLIHIEIQGDRKMNFAAGMYVYQYRAYDLYQKPVVGLAVLADESIRWRPKEFRYELWGTRQSYRFTAVKLMDFAEVNLEHSTNPFAIVTLAYLHAKKTRKRLEDRFEVKWRLIRNLYQSGFCRQQVIDLFRFIDWVLHLPKELDIRLREEIVAFEEIHKMPYISSVERIGHDRGMEEGILAGMQLGRQEGLLDGEKKGRQEEAASMLLKLMRRKFGQTPDWVTEKVRSADLELIETWSDNFVFANSVDEVFAS